MEVDEKPVARPRELDVNFVDDDELQTALARSRRAKIHKTKKATPAAIASKSKLHDYCFDLLLSLPNSCPGTL